MRDDVLERHRDGAGLEPLRTEGLQQEWRELAPVDGAVDRRAREAGGLCRLVVVDRLVAATHFLCLQVIVRAAPLGLEAQDAGTREGRHRTAAARVLPARALAG